MQFIALLLGVVDYTDAPEDYKPFSQRTLAAEVKGQKLSGRIEYMLARGKQIPSNPYFFLHEYKQETRKNSDPKGQLLVSMLAARGKNERDAPIYGCYVVGRLWFFVVLSANTYAVSTAYDSSKNDIYQIISILRGVKPIIKAINRL